MLMVDKNPRRSPLRVRKGTRKEFSRVATLLDAKIEKLEDRISVIEEKLGKQKPKRKRGPKKKAKPVEPVEPVEGLRELALAEE
jgi:hypothetical protein